MAETKQLLERAKRAFDPPTDVMDALVVRRDRKRRDQRIRAGVLGLAIAFGVGWLGVIAFRSTPPVPAVDPPELPNTSESWSRVQLDPPLAGGEAPSFLVAGPDRLAAVGVHGGPATAWTSSDGATWTRTPAEDLDRADIFDIRSGGPGFIATGSAVPEGGLERAIWTSEDGVSWSRLPDDPVFDDSFINAVGSGGPGLVAVGSQLGVWYSSDGSAWERASVPPVPPEIYPGDDGETPQIYLTDVADRGGRLVVTGWAMLDDNSEVVVVWTSRDGRSWTDVPIPADVFPPGSSISEITAGPDGFVAVGQITVGQVSTAALWFSPDGRDWRLHRPGPDGVELYSVAAGDGGYVAVGANMSCDTDCASREAVVMTSVDGETWARAPSGPEFRVDRPGDPENARGAAMFNVVAWGSRFAAVGEYDGEPTVWVTTAGVQEDVTTPPLPEPAPSGRSALAYGVDGDVFLANTDGSNAVRIADGVPIDGAEECAPGEERAAYIVFGTAWSPDGRYLAYWDWGCPWQVRDDPEDAWGIVRITDAAGNLVASFPGQGWSISWSPDSTRVAVMDLWVPADQGDATIGVYGLDGVRQAALTVPAALTPSGDYSPVWSRDGSAILLRSVQVPLDGDAPTPLNSIADGSTGFGVYSPDGSRFAHMYRGSLVVEDADEPDAHKVSGAWEFWDVAWSPNGDLVAFEGDFGTELLVRDVATGADTSLVDVTRSEWLEVIEFSPNGDRILFTRSDADGGAYSLWSIGADGSDLRRLLDGIDWADLRPQGQPS
jgi:Tol biopolymer transport system component